MGAHSQAEAPCVSLDDSVPGVCLSSATSGKGPQDSIVINLKYRCPFALTQIAKISPDECILFAQNYLSVKHICS